MKAIWITWEHHRRTREIARSLDLRLLELTSRRGVPWKYVSLLGRTTLYLLKARPTHLFVQCPSVILGLWAVLMQPLFGYVLVADLHNEAVEPFVNRSSLFRWMLRRLQRNANLSLVTNRALASLVEANGGRPFVLPDRVPILQSAPNKDYSNVPYTVVFVCTFALDEPYREVIEATRSLVDVATVHVTGGFDVEDWSGSVPQNLRFSGYLPDVAYEDLLRRSDVVVDLTAMEDCLVCGGYEAVALEKPLVTSDTRALRACFSRGTVFTRHDSTSIAAAIKDALNRRDELGHEMTLLRRDLEAAWEARKPVLMTQLEALAAK